jgi:exopolysaccharide biosynthesis protein
MQDLKCRDALNLDGGGSTLLFANDKILNKYNQSFSNKDPSNCFLAN